MLINIIDPASLKDKKFLESLRSSRSGWSSSSPDPGGASTAGKAGCTHHKSKDVESTAPAPTNPGGTSTAADVVAGHTIGYVDILRRSPIPYDMLGQKYTISWKLNVMLTAMITRLHWPQQKRSHVYGANQRGSCLGAIYERSVARLGHFSWRYTKLIKCINAIAKATLYDQHQWFVWGSIQVNVDTVSR